jgi:hypothetical protein
VGPFGPDITKAFSQADLALLSSSITNKCRDTVKDGMVGDVEACDFNLQTAAAMLQPSRACSWCRA